MIAKSSLSRRIFIFCDYLLCLILIVVCVYPFWYVIVQSLSGTITAGKALLLPYQPTGENYVRVFALEGVFQSFGISVARTVAGTSLTVFSCMLLGYLFSKDTMPFRKFLFRFLIITMYVSGGLIPTYLVMKAYGLINTFWIYILPSMVSAYYVILIKTFVEQLPIAVEESAMLDGASTMTIFLRIIVPMSKPIIATIAIFAAVGHWNSWFDNHIYTFTNKALTTMQYMLYNFLNEAERLAKITELTGQEIQQEALTPKAVRMTITTITILPIMMVYPFMQRFFVKGIMIGAVKG